MALMFSEFSHAALVCNISSVYFLFSGTLDRCWSLRVRHKIANPGKAIKVGVLMKNVVF
jgi:hypothetical protein